MLKLNQYSLWIFIFDARPRPLNYTTTLTIRRTISDHRQDTFNRRMICYFLILTADQNLRFRKLRWLCCAQIASLLFQAHRLDTFPLHFYSRLSLGRCRGVSCKWLAAFVVDVHDYRILCFSGNPRNVLSLSPLC
jgi:hypothetical protein